MVVVGSVGGLPSTEARGPAGVEELGAHRRGLPQIRHKRCPNVLLEVEPRPRPREVGRDGPEEPSAGATEAGLRAEASAGADPVATRLGWAQSQTGWRRRSSAVSSGITCTRPA